MLNTTILNSLFEHYEKENIKYCILRNYEGLPESLNSGDIDILIDRKSLSINKDIIVKLAKVHDLVIYNDFKDERLFQFFLYKKTGETSVYFLKIDFFIQSELYGCCYINNEDFLRNRKPYKNFYVVDDVNSIIDKVVYLYLLGAKIPERYLDKSQKIINTNSDDLSIKLQSILGIKHGSRLIKILVDKNNTFNSISYFDRFYILLKLFLNQPIMHLLHWPIFFFYAIKYRVFPQGTLISFSGPDGCGKTTVLDIFVGFLEEAFRFNDKNVFHHRPRFLPRIANIAKSAGVITEVDENYSKPHRGKPSGYLGSILRLFYYLLDYQVGYYFKVRKILKRREPVVFDRYFYDVIADCERTNISLSQRLLTRCLFFVPKPDSAFFINVSSNVVYKRKQELTLESINRLSTRYKALVSEREEFISVDNESSAKESAVTIIDNVIQRRAKKLKINRT